MRGRISLGMILGVLSLVAEGLGQLLVAPLLLKAFTPAQVGFWFLVTNFLVLIQLGQAGLAPVGVRVLSQAVAKSFSHWQVEVGTLGRAYLGANTVLMILIGASSFYISGVALKNHILDWKLLWICFAFGILCRTYALRWVSAINSTGLVGFDKIALIAGIALNVTGYVLVSILKAPLAWLGIVYGVVGLIYLIAIYLIHTKIGILHAIALSTPQTVDAIEHVSMTVGGYWRHSSSFLIINISGFFVLNFDVLLVEKLFGIEKVPYFSILAKLGALVLAVSTLFEQMAFPFIARAWSNNDIESVRALYVRGIFVSLSLAIFGAAALLICAPTMIPLLFGPNSYLGISIFASQLLFVLVSVHTIAQATPVLAIGTRQFTDLAVLNAISAIAGSYAFAKLFGLVGIPLGNAIGTLIPSVLHGLRSYSALYRVNRR